VVPVPVMCIFPLKTRYVKGKQNAKRCRDLRSPVIYPMSGSREPFVVACTTTSDIPAYMPGSFALSERALVSGPIGRSCMVAAKIGSPNKSGPRRNTFQDCLTACFVIARTFVSSISKADGST
jgi:hypothetical protein